MLGVTLATALSVTPPRTVLGWSRGDSPQVVGPADVFAYMDGAGELYLAYGLQRLDVYEYRSPAEAPITAEIYALRSSDDAYGLLSLDGDGEAVALDPGAPGGSPRALYGYGLLRAWSGDLYLRVMAATETPAARAAVVEIARAVLAGRPSAPPPALVAALPAVFSTGHVRRADRTAFLRSPLVLNSIYFLGTGNLLGLGPDTEAVVATCERPGGGPLHAVLVLYPDEAAAAAALAHFAAAYLHAEAKAGATTAAHVEDGWLACRRSGRRLALVFEADSEATAAAIAGELSR